MNPVENVILGETGSSEVQILEFCVGDSRYGIELPLVREMLQYRPVQPMPHTQSYVEGVICPRNELLTVIGLAAYLNHSSWEEHEQDIFIVAQVNERKIAFHVQRVIGVHQVPLAAIEKLDAAVFGGGAGLVTGIAKMNDSLITILDFGKIISDVDPHSGLQEDASAVQ